MRERQAPLTQPMTAAAVREDWSQVLHQVYRKQTRVVEKSGLPVAAIVSADDRSLLQRCEAERAQRVAALDRIGAAFKDMSTAELDAEAVTAVTAVRQEPAPQR